MKVKHKFRTRRSTDDDVIYLRLNCDDGRTTENTDDADNIDLRLHRSNKLIDDNFVFIKRDANQTELIGDFDSLIEEYSNCFYRNENSAIDLCDGNVVWI